jgi:GNAT superfamily N-acetyltransferase
MITVETRRSDYTLSTDKTRLDLALVYEYLSHSSYWARGRSYATVQRSIEHSLCFGVYAGDLQVGFARVVTDYATFAWLCDVFVVEPHRDRGLGKWLVEYVVGHPDLKDLRIFLLATRDAHDLYRHYGGFVKLTEPDRWMIRRPVPRNTAQ